MNNLSKSLREKLAFDPQAVREHFLGKADFNEFEAARAEATRLAPLHDKLISCVEALGQTKYLEFHGCVTGDCPHNHAHDCVYSLGQAMIQESKAASEALAALEKELGKSDGL